jgi:uncharacterized repeat protein (TIGR02543 family)
VRQELDEAKAAIEAGVYKIPAEITVQADKTAWVQNQVNSLIPAGNSTVALVTYNGSYSVGLVNGSLTDSAAITVTQPAFVTFSAPDANGGYSQTVETDSFGTTTLPADPVRTNYRFLGWYIRYSDGDWRFTADTVVTSNVTVSAKWASAPTSVTHAMIVFDSPMYNKDITMIAYSSTSNNECGAQAVSYRDDVAGRIDLGGSGTPYTVGRYMYLQLPQSYPDLRDATNVVFEITYYDIGTNSISFETANVNLTGTERNYGNRHNIPRSNTGQLVTYRFYLSNVGMQRGQNNSCDFRINGGGSGNQNMYIKSISLWPGTQP